MWRSSEQSAGLSDYLNHHLAGETLGVDLVKRASSENTGTRLGTFLELLSWEMEEDRDSLVTLMGELGVRRKRAGVVAAWIAEKLGRLKLHGQLTELEALHLAINGKLDMWTSLRHVRVDGVDFDELVHRTERQAEELERRRVAVATNALQPA